MSLFSALMASVSGMNAQANALSTISDNIANANTVGYKEASTQFEDMLNEFSPSEYNAGGVGTVINYQISQQGDPNATTDPTNMAIEGNGFFVVENASGQTFLTRAGSFEPNAQGFLVNASGYTLMGYPPEPSPPSYSPNDLVPVQVSTSSLSPAVASTTASLTGNLDSSATAVTTAADLPVNGGSSYTSMTSVTTYDSIGNPTTLNVYMTNMGGGQWEMDVYNSTAPQPPTATAPLSSTDLQFSTTTGALQSPTAPVSVTVNGQAIAIDPSKMTQLSAATSVQGTSNGNPPGTYESVSVSQDGILSETFSNGVTTPIYQIPLATVPSVDSMTSMAGDVFEPNANSGQMELGPANNNGFGSINGSEEEASTVDLATELTNMVVTQNSYQANSKAFSVGSDMLSELVNLLK
jgi:flagellar hook protein FlgE